MITPGDREDPSIGSIVLFVLIVAILAVIGIGAVRNTVPFYWWRVAAIALLTAVVFRLFAPYQERTDRSEDGDSADKAIQVGELGRGMAFVVFGGGLSWNLAGTAARSLSLIVGLGSTVLLIHTIRQTGEFLEQLEHRRYRTAASSPEWGWLLLTILGLMGSGRHGFQILTAGIAAAIAVPFTLFLQRREAEALELLPPEPTPALPRAEVEPEDASPTGGPWEGLPPIRPLL